MCVNHRYGITGEYLLCLPVTKDLTLVISILGGPVMEMHILAIVNGGLVLRIER